MNAITVVPQSFSYSELERMASAIAQSGLFGIKTQEQAIALMMIAHAEGRHPALAARDYDIIQGRPAKKAEAMLRDFLASGGKVEWHAATDTLADATFSHPQTGSLRIDWDMDRAKAAGLTGKDMYKKFPRQMLRSRVVSEGVRTLWPMATSGMYVPEEVRDMPDAEFTGQTIDAAPAPRPKPAPMPTLDAAPRPPNLIDIVSAGLAECTAAVGVIGVGDRLNAYKSKMEKAGKPVTDLLVQTCQDMIAKKYASFHEADMGDAAEPLTEDAA